MNNNTYVIVPFNEVTQQMINDCKETSIDTLRHSMQGIDRIILKWEGDTPASLIGYDQYNHTDILVEVAKTEWNEEASSSSSSSS